jgi:uncharacterized protein YdbL (DUF1318 family)
MKRFILGLCLVLLGSQAFGQTLHEAKAEGLIGERNDGYLGYVVTPPSDGTKALVKEVNNKRKTKFTQTAQNNNLKTEQVAFRFYQRAVKETVSGQFFQDAAGKWVKK